VEVEPIQEVPNAAETVFWVLKRYAANEPVHLIPLAKQKLRQVGSVLARDSGDQCSFHAGSIFFSLPCCWRFLGNSKNGDES